MKVTKLFYFDLFERIFFQKQLGSKNFKQNLRHQVVKVEALRVEVEAIQKLLLPHPCFKFILWFEKYDSGP